MQMVDATEDVRSLNQHATNNLVCPSMKSVLYAGI